MFRVLASTAVIGLLGGAAAVYHRAPEIAASALLHPARTTVAAVRPALLVHGSADVETPPAHSHRVYAALAGPKRLILVPGAGHNQSLHNVATWQEIDRWVDANMRGV